MIGRSTRRKLDDDSLGGPPTWMITYGDMMSLLLCMFILILSFSSVETDKFRKAAGSLRSALGVAFTPTKVSTNQQLRQQMEDAQTREALEEMEETLREQEAQKHVRWEMTPEGIQIVMNDPILFDLGKADLKPQAFPILQAVVKVIEARNPPEIEVLGHTDDLPIHTGKFPSNWELSAARALSIVQYFARQGNIEPRRLSAIGYGEYRPAYQNTERDRPKNRRVEILLKTSGTRG